MGTFDEGTVDRYETTADYLEARVAQVFDTPNAARPRWTAQDAEAVAWMLRTCTMPPGPAPVWGSADTDERTAKMPERDPHLELYDSTQNRRPVTRWRLVGANGEKMAASQGYTRRTSARAGAKRAHPGLDIRDLTKHKPRGGASHR